MKGRGEGCGLRLGKKDGRGLSAGHKGAWPDALCKGAWSYGGLDGRAWPVAVGGVRKVAPFLVL